MSELFFILGPVLGVVFSFWVFYDALARKNSSFAWTFLTCISGPFIALPLYFAYRNLKAGEVREGGTVWNIIRNYTLSWTAFMIGMMFITLPSKRAEFIVGVFIVWFFVTFCMLVFGFFIKQSGVIERGTPELE